MNLDMFITIILNKTDISNIHNYWLDSVDYMKVKQANLETIIYM